MIVQCSFEAVAHTAALDDFVDLHSSDPSNGVAPIFRAKRFQQSRCNFNSNSLISHCSTQILIHITTLNVPNKRAYTIFFK